MLKGNSEKISKDLVMALQAVCPNGVLLNVDLSKISRWKIGGIADCLVRPRSSKQLATTIILLQNEKIPYVVIGSTTNLLFSDEGLRAVCIQIGSFMSAIKVDGHRVWCQAGIWVPCFSRRVAQAGLAGVEHACGIPGTLGGLICMNGGSQRKEIGDHLINATAVNQEGLLTRYAKAECNFAYRRSIFQENNNIIVEAEFEFPENDEPGTIRKRMLLILNERRKKFPQKLPNCGSVFVSNPELYEKFGPPGAIIERLGLKGLHRGGAEISLLHANFINNTGDATAQDVLLLIKHIRNTVYEKTGCFLDSEVRFVTPNGHLMSASGFIDLQEKGVAKIFVTVCN